MSLNARILQSIQQAGQSLHDCREQLKAEVSRHTEQLISVMASQPLGPAADNAFGQLKHVARIHQELQAIEEQLRGIYRSADQITGEEVQVIDALPHRRASASSGSVLAEDAQLINRAGKRKVRETTAVVQPKSGAVASSSLRSGGRVSTNDDKVLAALRRLLKSSKNATLSQAQISSAAGVPVGSMAASLRRLLASGVIRQIARGRYQLN